MSGALDGIKVLDLSRILAGPWCTQTLADLGAEVWKVEHPERGDDTRSWRPPEIGELSTYFLCCNRSKKSLAIDIAKPEGAELVRRLAAEADVVVENFRLGALARYGLDWESLRAVNPRLVYCSISGYGRESPRAAEPGYDFVIQAESGLMAITGEADGQPMKLGVAICDLLSGMNATQAILAALIARGRTGEGQHIDISLLDSAVAALANVASGHLGTGREPKRYGNAHATVVPYQLFPTSDGEIALAVGNDAQFRKLCEVVIERPELADDPRYATNRARVLNRQSLIPALNEAFQQFDTADCLQRLRAAGIPAGTVRSVSEVFEAPEVLARGLRQVADKAGLGPLPLPGSPLKLSGTPIRPAIAPPDLGEHTEEVLGEILGLDAEAVAGFREAGVVR
ncbi:CaiB/BaiF CoA transferase family protein [Aquibaculum sediminis]|uniref:CaiB/BaiF CoA transferase family protein n=1 Tax=Aquibaculum sediminis TaxID=3231907 RepID=UPI003456532B